MSIYKCKMCGGSLDVESSESVAVCEYCGAKQTLPRVEEERLVRLHDRANSLRLDKEFDKATNIYENIIAETPEDSEAYWGLVLCKYGIEYVDDPRTHRRIPTVNRANSSPVLSDRDFKSAIEYADSFQQEVLNQQAQEIDSVLRGILSISAKAERYDIFICYKETDDGGERTEDSVYAQSIYNALIKEGYKVFFSRITLENVLGQQYEPYIFAALNSAKVMLVVGTSKENFNAVWVKNEWSRFLTLIADGADKTLIPCYKGMSPYDMPVEFKFLQSQDMNKIGFIQDLQHGIEKLIPKQQPQQAAAPVRNAAAPIGANAGVYAQKIAGNVGSFINDMINDPGKKINSILQGTPVATIDTTDPNELTNRAFGSLANNDWANAVRYADAAIRFSPTMARAYLAKLFAEYKVKNIEQLTQSRAPFETSYSFRQAMAYGDDKLKKELDEAVKKKNAKNEELRIESIYNRAVGVMNRATSSNLFETAAADFNSIPNYKDSAQLSKKCKEKAAECRKSETYNSAVADMKANRTEKYLEAINKFQSLSGWGDSENMIGICRQSIEVLKQQEEQNRIEQAKKKAQKQQRNAEIKKQAIIITVVVLIVCFIALLAVVLVPRFFDLGLRILPVFEKNINSIYLLR